jgi:vacuolar-type H+-ATPase subunit F/Vma7
MSRLLVVTRPGLVAGFHLAGVDAFGAEDARAAQKLIARWLDMGERGLLAIDESLLAGLDPAFRQRLSRAEQLLYLALPGGDPESTSLNGRHYISALLRQALGFHITFRSEEG